MADFLHQQLCRSGWPPSACGAFFFLTFWLITLGAFLLAHRPLVRRFFVVIFFTCLLIPGLVGRTYWLWPFQTWHLWGGIQPRAGLFHELWLEDARGELHLYDRRAIPPMLNTQVQELGARCFDPARIDQRAPLCEFLLRQANTFRDRHLADARRSALPHFPMRQYGRAWTRDELVSSGPFTRVRARRNSIAFSDGGRQVTVTTLVEFQWP